jgi:hypothetical protein
MCERLEPQHPMPEDIDVLNVLLFFPNSKGCRSAAPTATEEKKQRAD